MAYYTFSRKVGGAIRRRLKNGANIAGQINFNFPGPLLGERGRQPSDIMTPLDVFNLITLTAFIQTGCLSDVID